MQGLFHFEIPDYPEEVYREGLLNAFVHRDYNLSGPVYVRQYPDRLEISNPGGFFGDVGEEIEKGIGSDVHEAELLVPLRGQE